MAAARVKSFENPIAVKKESSTRCSIVNHNLAALIKQRAISFFVATVMSQIDKYGSSRTNISICLFYPFCLKAIFLTCMQEVTFYLLVNLCLEMEKKINILYHIQL